MSLLLVLSATVIAAAILAGITYFFNQKRHTVRKAKPYPQLPRHELLMTREETIAMLERQFNNSPSSGPDRNR
ncbi:MAG: hypothetical protein H7Y22_01415 [Gemmatimonadaceae bacterium]|nr:hypothetical protein [Gloeobacterales cyanobacterium ES-bin-141]